MLTEERHAIILQYINDHKAATVTELTQLLDTSESTIRRDLTTLDNSKQLRKVHGGATALESNGIVTTEQDVRFKATQFGDEKRAIGKVAAGLIHCDDFVYIDAGTTTEALVDAITEKAVYFTNGLIHAQKLMRKGYEVHVPSGCLRSGTEAIVGLETLESLKKYHFTCGFFGTNGIDPNAGFTTPDIGEAQVKREAFSRSQKVFVLSDASKFNQVAPVTFGDLERATIITDHLEDLRYREKTSIMEVE